MLLLTSSFATVATKLRDAGTIQFKDKKVAFIPTASDPYQDKSYLNRDRASLVDLGCEVYDVGLKEKEGETLKKALEPADIVFVAGGNVIYLAEQMRKSGFMEMIRSLLATRDYIGSSAGSILLGPSVQPFYAEDIGDLPKDFVLTDNRGLGLVESIVVPHVNESAFAKENEEIKRQFGSQFQIKPMKDDEYLIEELK